MLTKLRLPEAGNGSMRGKGKVVMTHDKAVPQPAPVVTVRASGRIVEAICPLCKDVLSLSQRGSAEEQESGLQDTFDWHLKMRHRSNTKD